MLPNPNNRHSGPIKPAPDAMSQIWRLEQNGYTPGSKMTYRAEAGGYIIVSTWLHPNKFSVLMVDDGKAVAVFQRASI